MKELVLGCIPSTMDGSEKIFGVSQEITLPETYSYKEFLPKVLNQGSDQICVPCTVSSYLNWKENLKDGINKRIEDLMDKDEDTWKRYSNQPLELLQLKEFVDTEERKELIEKNLDFLMDSRNSNGLFDVNWSWNNDYEEIELQRVKWVGLLLVNNLITFKKFDRIEK